jgi:hypothetical protein
MRELYLNTTSYPYHVTFILEHNILPLPCDSYTCTQHPTLTMGELYLYTTSYPYHVTVILVHNILPLPCDSYTCTQHPTLTVGQLYLYTTSQVRQNIHIKILIKSA